MKRALIPFIVSILAAIVMPAVGTAGTFIVDPVRIELNASRPYMVARITNLADEPATIQAHVAVWTAGTGGDEYRSTDEVLLNPPIFTLGPREKQFMRLGLRHPNPNAAEVSYRLFLEEVPRPPKPGFTGLQTVLRLSIPIFCRPAVPAPPQLAWSVEPAGEGVRLSVANRGRVHVQIRGIEISAGNGSRANRSMLDYVLPNQSKSWLINLRPASLGTISLKAATDAGELHEELAFGDR